MSDELSELEQAAEREMRLLDGLPLVTPSPACVQCVEAAVHAEASRMRSRRRRRLWARTAAAFGVAAAILVAVRVTRGPDRSGPATTDADVVLSEWAAAMDESTSRLSALASAGLAAVDGESNEERDLDDLFDSLDQSLRALEDL